ncbi:flavin reductase family protein [Litoribrevibacter albus]|uniref:Ferredoxin reductase n=1 Tax=Litoribrevibacter albus TaxID=1473156 RepID=A0AA37W6I8_9GAMM|nr:iron-sulfur cluster-binding domain-containing protein [Litoribrevibacter albus]GLQ30268.1 ferredoxin reductase [Litoribrevibacter albus]
MSQSSEFNFSTKNQRVKRKIKTLLNESLVNSSSLRSYYEPLIQPFVPSWSVKKFRAKVIDLERITQNVIRVTLKPSKKWAGFESGQFIELSVVQDGALVSRCFSISSSRQHWLKTGKIELTIREQEQGRITPWLLQGLKKYQHVQISKAKGHFTFNASTTSSVPASSPVLMLAGGTGITPILSMLSDIAHYQQKVDLIFFSRDSHLYKEELSRLATSHEKLSVHYINTQEQGHCSEALLNTLCPDFLNRDIYLCGPSQMSEDVTHLLESLEFDSNRLHQEHFLPIRKKATSGQNISASIRFNKAGLTTEIEATNEQTLLEAAEAAKLSPNYGCRMGICHQCKCNKTKGVVLNTVTGEVSDTSEEVIQLCVSVPLSDLEVQL